MDIFDNYYAIVLGTVECFDQQNAFRVFIPSTCDKFFNVSRCRCGFVGNGSAGPVHLYAIVLENLSYTNAGNPKEVTSLCRRISLCFSNHPVAKRCFPAKHTFSQREYRPGHIQHYFPGPFAGT
jgi:hypothetical protein